MVRAWAEAHRQSALLTSATVAASLVAAVGVFGRFARRKPLGGIGAFVLLILVMVSILAPLIAPADPNAINILDKYASPGETTADGHRFLLGSDQLGRDILSRLIYGARISLYVGLVSVGIGVTLGALIGIVSGYLGGAVDLVLQRIVDGFMAFPALVLALGIMAVLGPSLNNVILALVIVFLPGASRLLRSEALRVKEMMYIDAAKAMGNTDWRIIFRHVMPNALAAYIVFATANLGVAIVVEASLTFLGVGTPLTTPSWGGMISQAGRNYIEVSPWLLLMPSIAICLAVFSFNLLGDSLRDVLDPRLRGAP